MKQTAHTEGKFGKLTATFLGIDSSGRADVRIGQLPYGRPYSDLVPLIEALPELLEACKAALGRGCLCSSSRSDDWHGEQCPIPILRAAIHKAEGQ